MADFAAFLSAHTNAGAQPQRGAEGPPEEQYMRVGGPKGLGGWEKLIWTLLSMRERGDLDVEALRKTLRPSFVKGLVDDNLDVERLVKSLQ